jgi:hypothetical protein
MGRIYSIPLTNSAGVAGTGATLIEDAFEITAASGKPFWLHEVVIGQTSDFGDAQAEGLPFIVKKGIGHTAGSGGQSVTPAKHLTNDAAAGATAKICNTTQAVVGAGSLTTIRGDGWNVQGGEQYLPTPETRILFLPAEACVISLAAPADALTLIGTAVIEEL